MRRKRAHNFLKNYQNFQNPIISRYLPCLLYEWFYFHVSLSGNQVILIIQQFVTPSRFITEYWWCCVWLLASLPHSVEE